MLLRFSRSLTAHCIVIRGLVAVACDALFGSWTKRSTERRSVSHRERGLHTAAVYHSRVALYVVIGTGNRTTLAALTAFVYSIYGRIVPVLALHLAVC